MVRTASLIALALLSPALVAGPAVAKAAFIQSFHRIDGFRYRVRTFSDYAMVWNKGMDVPITFQEQDRRKQAARVASGCEPMEFSWRLQGMAVRLDCSKRPADYVAPPEVVPPKP